MAMQQNVGEAVFGPDDDDRRRVSEKPGEDEKVVNKGHMA